MKTPNEEFENGINPNSSSEPLECEIKVSLQPLRINIDQVIHFRQKRKDLIYILGYTCIYEKFLCEFNQSTK
jgi:hypothetical protein